MQDSQRWSFSCGPQSLLDDRSRHHYRALGRAPSQPTGASRGGSRLAARCRAKCEIDRILRESVYFAGTMTVQQQLFPRAASFIFPFVCDASVTLNRVAQAERRGRQQYRRRVTIGQFTLVVVVIAAWHFGSGTLFDPFFVGDPIGVAP